MKNIFILFCLVSLTAFAQKTDRSELIIPPKQVVQIDYPNGQKIYLELKGKRILLLTVTDTILHEKEVQGKN